MQINKRVMYERATYYKRVYAKGFMYLSLVITCIYVSTHNFWDTNDKNPNAKNPFKPSKLGPRLPSVGD